MFSISNSSFEEDSLTCIVKQAYIKLKVAAFTLKHS